MKQAALTDQLALRWKAAPPRRRALWASLMLSAAIVAMFGLLFAVLPLTGNGLIFRDDDFKQHYPFLMAIGRWLRAFFRNPSKAAMFNWSLGLGADWIGSLNYYGFGDPLTLLAVFFSESTTYTAYVLLVLLRHVLAGLAFLALARGFGVRWRNALIAAAAYAYTHFMIAWCALTHPMFANPVIHLPLMILGCEKRFRGEAPWTLMLATAWSALCGFYFFYMNSLMLFLFALVRYFSAWRAKMTLPQAFARAVVPFLLGVGLAMPVLLPALAGFLDSARATATSKGSLLFEQASAYWEFPIAFISSNGWNRAMTVPVAAMIAVCALFRRKGHLALKLSVAAAALALLVPAVGVVFNGFSYSVDRWKYGAVLLYIMVFAMYLPEVERGAAGAKYCAGALVWSAVLMLRWKLTGAKDINVMIILLAAALSAAGLVYLFAVRRIRRPRRAAAVLLVFLAGNLLANSLLLCGDHIVNDRVSGSAWQRRSQTSLWAARDDGARTELTNAEYGRYNAPSVTGTASTSVYMSIQPAATTGHLAELEVGTMVNPLRMHGLDTRAALEAVWAVGGMTCPSGSTVAAPYGFELVSDDGQYQYWRNTLALPTAWTLDARMSRPDWEALSAVEKQWALLQCAVTDGSAIAPAAPEQSARTIECRVGACENASLEGGVLRFGKGGGSVELEFEGLPDSETYLIVKGLVPRIRSGQFLLRIRCGDGENMLLVTSDDYLYSLRRRDFTAHLGYAGQAQSRAVISADGRAEFALDAMQIVCQPMAGFEALVNARREGVVSASPLGDTIRAELDLPGDRLVCFSVPAVRGWTARLDGNPVPLLANADALWMAEVPRGAHTLELVYRVPGMRPGFALAALCALAAAAWGIAGNRRRRREP